MLYIVSSLIIYYYAQLFPWKLRKGLNEYERAYNDEAISCCLQLFENVKITYHQIDFYFLIKLMIWNFYIEATAIITK